MSEYLDGSQRDRSGPARQDAGDLADVSDEDLMQIVAYLKKLSSVPR